MKNTLTMAIVMMALVLTTVTFSSVSANNPGVNNGRVETRCGWFSNPTPGNAWLNDRHGEWLIGIQGGHQADGDWPTFKDKDWIKTNVHYGYGCACMRVQLDHETKTVLKIYSASSRPLATCRKDRRLKEPK